MSLVTVVAECVRVVVNPCHRALQKKGYFIPFEGFVLVECSSCCVFEVALWKSVSSFLQVVICIACVVVCW